MRQARSVLRGMERRRRPIEFSTPPFLPGTVRIAKEGLDAQGIVKPVMFGKLGAIVEADRLAQGMWEAAELLGDGPGGENGFSIDRMLNNAEAGLPFVQHKQPLAVSGEQHEVGLPVAWHLAVFNLGGPFGDRAPVFDEACGAATSAAATPADKFVARQQLVPVILLGRTVIDKPID